VRGTKDTALAAGARVWLNSQLKGIGEMTELAIDTKKRTVQVRLHLIGESEPIEIHVKKYNLKQNGQHAALTIEDASASRPWIEEGLRRFVIGHAFGIPAGAAALLKLLA
jgi:hypothetical protein